MTEKEFGVFGLGDFGKSVALTLAREGCQVLAVDNNEETVSDVADYVTQAIKMDVRDIEALRSLSLGGMDGIIIGLSANLEASIMVAMVAKEAGVPYVLAKVHDDVQAHVLQKIGVDEVIFPEVAMGMRIAKALVNGKYIDLIALSDEFSIVEIKSQPMWVGKTLNQLRLRNRYNINMLGKKIGEKVEMWINPDEVIKENEVWIVLGQNRELDKMLKES
ncbi:MAG: TrkA family potassium uptake protein [Clostridiales bacterium]|nr:TrkA family potassium uptake protein [Clostridiales bacterium]